MTGADLLPEFDHEFALTRTSLERVPEDHFDWKPHEKSYTLHELSAHLVQIPFWAPATLNTDLLDMDEPMERDVPESLEGLLARFDAGVAEARKALEATPSETMDETWRMKAGGEIVMSMPKAAVLRGFVFNHNIHHRAQLGVYLRLLDVPVPAIYGPSADESGI